MAFIIDGATSVVHALNVYAGNWGPEVQFDFSGSPAIGANRKLGIFRAEVDLYSQVVIREFNNGIDSYPANVTNAFGISAGAPKVGDATLLISPTDAAGSIGAIANVLPNATITCLGACDLNFLAPEVIVAGATLPQAWGTNYTVVGLGGVEGLVLVRVTILTGASAQQFALRPSDSTDDSYGQGVLSPGHAEFRANGVICYFLTATDALGRFQMMQSHPLPTWNVDVIATVPDWVRARGEIYALQSPAAAFTYYSLPAVGASDSFQLLLSMADAGVPKIAMKSPSDPGDYLSAATVSTFNHGSALAVVGSVFGDHSYTMAVSESGVSQFEVETVAGTQYAIDSVGYIGSNSPPVIANNLPTGGAEDGDVEISFDMTDNVQVALATLNLDFTAPDLTVIPIIIGGAWQLGYFGEITVIAGNGFRVRVTGHPLFVPGLWEADIYVEDDVGASTTLNWSWTVAALGLTMAPQSTLNSIDFVFDREPRHIDPHDPNDGTNLDNYAVVGATTPFVERLLQTVTYEGDDTLRLYFDGPLVEGEQYQITVTDIASVNPVIMLPTVILITAFEAGAAPIPLERKTATKRDIRNPQTPRDAPAGGALGTFVTDDGGDLDTESGRRYLRKRIFRRLSTVKGSIFHLPNYGLKIESKTLIGPTRLRRLQTDAEAQIAEEPGVVSVRASVGTLTTGVVVLKVVVTDAFGSFEVAHAFGEE